MLLQQLLASRTVEHLFVPSCTGATFPCLSHCCSLLVSCCPGAPTLKHSLPLHSHPSLLTSASLATPLWAPIARYNPRGWVPQGSYPSLPLVLLTTARCLPTSSQVVHEHSWHNRHPPQLLSPPLLALPWTQKPLPCSSSSDTGLQNHPGPHHNGST